VKVLDSCVGRVEVNVLVCRLFDVRCVFVGFVDCLFSGGSDFFVVGVEVREHCGYRFLLVFDHLFAFVDVIVCG